MGKECVSLAFRQRYWCYLLLSIADVEANYLIVLAYRFTTIISVQVRINIKSAAISYLNVKYLKYVEVNKCSCFYLITI